MASVLNMRNWIYWWVFMTSFVFLHAPATDLAKNLRNSALFSQNSFPFSIAGGFTTWLDDRAAQMVKAFQFDPNVVVIKTGNTLILDGFRVGLLLIVLLSIFAVRYYVRALSSPAIYDDLAALLVCFFVYHMVAQTLKIIKAGALGPAAANITLGDQMINERSNWVWFLSLVIVGIAIGGRGWMDSKVFWRGAFELFFTWLFLIPNAASGGFANVLDMLVGFATAITDPKNGLWTLAWALAGLWTAINRLYGPQFGGGGVGAPPRPVNGGLLGGLRRGRSKGA